MQIMYKFEEDEGFFLLKNYTSDEKNPSKINNNLIKTVLK